MARKRFTQSGAKLMNFYLNRNIKKAGKKKQ